MARGGTIFIALLLTLAAGLSALTSGLDSQVLSNEVRSANPAWNSNFELHLVPFCANESLQVRTTYHGQPAAGKIVALYSYDGGRHLLSQVKTTPDGWAIFARRPPGRYDMVATNNAGNLVIVTEGLVQAVDYTNDSFGQIFFTIPPCISEPSGAGWNESIARPAANDEPVLVQDYPAGISREFYAVQLPDGREATRVRVRIQRPAHDANLNLSESLPVAAVPSQALVGFEWAYPDLINASAPLSLQWNLPSSSRGGEDELVYVVLRPLTAAQAAEWTAPVVTREGATKNETGGITGADGAASNTSGANADNSSASASASGASASALRLDFSGVFGLGLLVPLILIGVATFLFRRMKAAQEKKEA